MEGSIVSSDNSVPAPSSETLQRVRTLLEGMQKTYASDSRAYLEAHAELNGMGYEAGRAIYALLEPQITAERKKKEKSDVYIIRCGLLGLAGCVLAGVARLLHFSTEVCVYLALAAMLPNGVRSVTAIINYRRMDVPYNAIAEAISIRDHRMLPILLDLGELTDSPSQRERITLCVLEYLPQIVTEGASPFTSHQLRALHKMLYVPSRPSKNEPVREVKLQVAILQALGHIGDETSLRSIKKIADNSYYPVLRQAAIETLPLLEARIQRMRLDLLRPSQAPTEASQTLLRPATAAPPEPAEQLLRASDEER